MDVILECMTMTSFGGEAKSLALQAIALAREGKFEEAESTLEKTEEALAKSHESHARLLNYDAKNGDLKVTIFLVHAADHLASAETVTVLAREIILLHKEVKKNV
ncbi:MAG: PTS lactose/cellobiose transporter subunit IIA [Leptolinea sp.]|nr:PTS lactose/cellobiose transporter subunit IIA [Leptolinea sp.]